MDRHYLSSLFDPRSIVVFAGNPDAAEAAPPLARALVEALREPGYEGQLTWLDIAMTGTLAELAQSRADLAVIALPPGQIAAALEVAGRIRCRAALVLASGVDAASCDALHAIARQHGMLLMGPNSLGFARPPLKLNANAFGSRAARGPLALVSQSGALTTAMLDWAEGNGVGFSTVVSLGPNSAVDLPQVLDFLANDAATQSILVYMEGIHHARRFMSALRAAAYAKPVVVMKAGRKPEGTRVALTHSAAIVGSDDVFEAAFRRAGVVRVGSFTQLFSAAKCLASRYRPVGRRLAIVTNGGGPAVLAADWANERSLQVARLGADEAAALKALLPPGATVEQVIDLGEDAGPEHYRAALQACAASPEVDGVLAIHSPKPGGDAEAVAAVAAEVYGRAGKPLLACWMGDERVRTARQRLNAAGVPHFRAPEAAVDAFHNIASFYRNQQLLQQTPPPLTDLTRPDTEGARLLIEGVLAERRKVLTEMESKALLAAYHVPVTRTMLARNANEAMLISSQQGYPVADRKSVV
mgnify:FL=1